MRCQTVPRTSPADSQCFGTPFHRGPSARTVRRVELASWTELETGLALTSWKARLIASLTDPGELALSATGVGAGWNSSAAATFGKPAGLVVITISALPRSTQRCKGFHSSGLSISSQGDHDPSPAVKRQFPCGDSSVPTASHN